MSTELKKVSQAIAAIDKVSVGIGALRNEYGGILYEVDTPAGMKAAKEARLSIRTPRYEVERIRKEAKRPLLDLGKKLDAEALRITKELFEIEQPIDAQIAAEEERLETAKQAAIRAELERVTAIQERIATIQREPDRVRSFPSAQIVEVIESLERVQIDESFAEFRDAAIAAKDAALLQLRAARAAAVEDEAERERVKAERKELARLRQEKADRDAVEARSRHVDHILSVAGKPRWGADQSTSLASTFRGAPDIPGPEPVLPAPAAKLPVIHTPTPEQIVRTLMICYLASREQVIEWLISTNFNTMTEAA